MCVGGFVAVIWAVLGIKCKEKETNIKLEGCII